VLWIQVYNSLKKEISSDNEMGEALKDLCISRLREHLESLGQRRLVLNAIFSDRDTAVYVLNFISDILNINLATIKKIGEVDSEESDFSQEEIWPTTTSIFDDVKNCITKNLFHILKRLGVLDGSNETHKTDTSKKNHNPKERT